MVQGTFSPARAWRPAAVARLARTLGSAMCAVQYASRVSACRRELSSHESARPHQDRSHGMSLHRCRPSSEGLYPRRAPVVAASEPCSFNLELPDHRPRKATSALEVPLAPTATTPNRQSDQPLATAVRSRCLSIAGSAFMAVSTLAHVHSRPSRRPPTGAALPNTSFKRTANGAPPWPRGRVGYHRPRGQGVTPLAAV